MIKFLNHKTIINNLVSVKDKIRHFMLLKLFQAHVALINNEYYLIKLKSLKKHILMSKLTGTFAIKLKLSHFHDFLFSKSLTIMLHPYGLFLFSLFYSVIIKSNVAFCDFYNPLEMLGNMLLSEPSPKSDESKIDEGAINYPEPILSIADLLLSDSAHKSSLGYERDSDSSEENSVSHSSEDSETDPEPHPLQQTFNNFIPLVEKSHGNPTIHDMREYLDYMRDTMPQDLWSKTREEISEINNIAFIINNLDTIITLPNESNIVELIYYKSAITVYDILQVTNKMDNDDLIIKLFNHTMTRYSNHYFPTP